MDVLSFSLQGSYTGFVYTYAVAPPMSLPHKTAGYLTSVFWAAISLGRLATIPLSYRFKSVRLLTFNQVGKNLISWVKAKVLQWPFGLNWRSKACLLES